MKISYGKRQSHRQSDKKHSFLFKNNRSSWHLNKLRKVCHYVPKYLQSKGYNIIPINPNAEQILGKQCLKDIEGIEETIDVIQIFRPSDQVLPFVKSAISKNPKTIWLQKGIHNTQAEKLALEKGIDVVFNRCMFEEHQRLFG